jgi:quinoprotein glucose dehydrogenase
LNLGIIAKLTTALAGCALISCSVNIEREEISDPYNSWRFYRGDQGSKAYSSLKQINTGNVHQLVEAWTYTTDDGPVGYSRASIQCNPIIVDDILYGTSAALKAFALNAATGERIWQFNPGEGDSIAHISGNNRGLNYWEEGEDKRLFYVVQNQLLALDARTGQLITDFGRGGAVDLREGLDREFDETSFITNTTPGVVYRDLLIMGSSVLEGYGSMPGHIRAYNVRTGQLAWIFHTIPHPGEFGYETWPKDFYKVGGGANAWGGLSIDTERGILYTATGAATHDFYGGDRVGKGLFANSVLALDAATGNYKWHFQVSHHDVWDYDLPAAPILITLDQNGKKVDAVAQLTKQGFIFVFDRATGEPLFEVKEKSVPQSNVEGETTWPTQPFPVKPPPLVRQHFDSSMVTDISPEATTSVFEQIKGYTLGGIYTPPSLNGTVQLPGFRGGAEWSGGAFDPESGMIYVGANDMPNLVQLIDYQPRNRAKLSEFNSIADYGRAIYQANCASCHGNDKKGSINFPSLLQVKDSLALMEAKSLLETGRGMMPSFRVLPESERRAVLAFLYELETNEALKLMPLDEVPAKDTGLVDPNRKYRLKAYKQLRDHNDYPGIKPPWGNLVAVDLNTGTISWKIPLGEYQELTKQGIAPTGTQLFGGGIVTAGGVIFIGASRDEKFRAFNKDTGALLWEYQLPAGGYATPSTYAVNGQQFVVIAAGGGGFQGTKLGDKYLAFKLP